MLVEIWPLAFGLESRIPNGRGDGPLEPCWDYRRGLLGSRSTLQWAHTVVVSGCSTGVVGYINLLVGKIRSTAMPLYQPLGVEPNTN